jgi:hypothetical protein
LTIEREVVRKEVVRREVVRREVAECRSLAELC